MSRIRIGSSEQDGWATDSPIPLSRPWPLPQPPSQLRCFMGLHHGEIQGLPGRTTAATKCTFLDRSGMAASQIQELEKAALLLR